MGEETDRFTETVETKVQAEFGCPECDAERVAAAATSVRESTDGPDWGPAFVVAKLTDAPKSHSVPEKWNWLLGYLGGTHALDEYRIEA